MTDRNAILKALQQLDQRVTVGDVAAKAGLDIRMAEQGLLTLASDVGGALQVAETGEIVYLFPKDPAGILRRKSLKLQWQAWWQKVWVVLFYLIRISFGIFLILSIVILAIALLLIILGISASQKGDNDDRRDGDGLSFFDLYFLSRIFSETNWGWFFYMGHDRTYSYPDQSHHHSNRKRKKAEAESSMNFLEAVFSFLFGDGHPNPDLEERRWQTVATVIRNHQGVVVAEQIAPYLDEMGQGFDQEYENYMIPVLCKFNGSPQVSPTGDLIYCFPELQTMASEWKTRSIASYLEEKTWKFSSASSGQIMGAIGLGSVNLVLAFLFGAFTFSPEVMQGAGEFVGFVAILFPVLFLYAIGFFVIPGLRFLWLQGRNQKVNDRNQQRQQRAKQLHDGSTELQRKLSYAQQFATENILTLDKVTYTTERDLIEQEIEQKDKIDEEWQKRLDHH